MQAISPAYEQSDSISTHSLSFKRMLEIDRLSDFMTDLHERMFFLGFLVFVIFLFLLVSGLASVCYCGTPLTFLFTFLRMDFRIQFKYS